LIEYIVPWFIGICGDTGQVAAVVEACQGTGVLTIRKKKTITFHTQAGLTTERIKRHGNGVMKKANTIVLEIIPGIY